MDFQRGLPVSTDTQVYIAAGGDFAHAAHSDDWLRSRTSDELRDLINRGFAGGDLFIAATAEAERRSGEARKLAEMQAAVTSREQTLNRRRFLLLRILVGLSLLATIFATAVVIARLDSG